MTGLERAVVVRKLEHLRELLALLRAESTTTALRDLEELGAALATRVAM